MVTATLDKHDALLIVDVQNDFLGGGSLAVLDGDAIIPVLNSYIEIFSQLTPPIFASRDWHPPNHCSFQVNGGQWPVHCVAGSWGAEFPKELNLPSGAIVISKAQQIDKDAYSAMDGTDLKDHLQKVGCHRLFIGGLATDYCVLHTVQDALALGFKVLVLEDATRAVNLNEGDGKRALAEMKKSGAERISFSEVSLC